MIHPINKLIKTILINTEKIFDKTEYPFLIKTISKLGIERDFLNLIKYIYENPIANIMLNGERPNAFSLRLRARQRYLLLPILFSTESFSQYDKARKRNKRHS